MVDFDRVRSSAANHAVCPICLDALVSLPQEVGALTAAGQRVEPALYHCSCVGVVGRSGGRPRLPGGCSPVTRRPVDGFEFMPPLRDRQKWMSFIDWNRDGSVTVAELSVAVAALLPVDENGTEQFVRDAFAVGDDVISKGELEASVLTYLESHLAELTKTAPSESAPVLSRSSTRPELLQWFKHWDADGSGCLDAEELHYALAALFFRTLGGADSATKQAVTEAFFLEVNLDRDEQISKTKFLENLAPALQANLPSEASQECTETNANAGSPVCIRLLSATTGTSVEVSLPANATVGDLRQEAQQKLLADDPQLVPEMFLAGRRFEGSDDMLLASFRGFQEAVVVQVLARSVDEEANRLRRMREEIAREREAVRRQREDLQRDGASGEAGAHVEFLTGARVQLQGLGRPELNGRFATILRFDRASARYVVDVDGLDGGQKSVRPSNLSAASTSANPAFDSLSQTWENFKRGVFNACLRVQALTAQYEWWQLLLCAFVVFLFVAAFFDVTGRYGGGGDSSDRGGRHREESWRDRDHDSTGDAHWDEPGRGKHGGRGGRHREEAWRRHNRETSHYDDYDEEGYYDQSQYEGGSGGGLLGGWELQSLLLLAGLGYLCWTGVIPVHRMSFFELMMLWTHIVEPLLMGRRGRGRGYGGSLGGFGRMGGFGMGPFGGLGGFGRRGFF